MLSIFDRTPKVGSSPGHCVVFLGNTFYSQSASLYPGVTPGLLTKLEVKLAGD